MSDGNRTEKPSARKLLKTRRDGSYVVSKEFAGAIQFTIFLLLLVQFGDRIDMGCRTFVSSWLRQAFFPKEIQREALPELIQIGLFPYLMPILGLGFVLTLAMVVAQLTVSQLGLSGKNLAPQVSKLNPLSRLKEMPRQNMASALQATVLLPVFLGAIYLLVETNAVKLLRLPYQSIASGEFTILAILKDLLYKATFAFLIVGVIDWYRQQSRYTKQLMMSKQDIKDEHKDSEGNPQLKAKLRKMQRDNSRRQMITNVPKASAIIVNPTHYSIAVRYELGGSGAPKVVAKGRNYLARRIREIAIANEIPIVENPPLARALYAAVDVGQEIPPHLYRAVAEILAYLYKVLGGRLPGMANA